MDPKTEKLLQILKNKKVGIFCDNANLYHAEKKKNILFVSYEENMAWELRQCWHIYLNRIKDEVIFSK